MVKDKYSLSEVINITGEDASNAIEKCKAKSIRDKVSLIVPLIVRIGVANQWQYFLLKNIEVYISLTHDNKMELVVTLDCLDNELENHYFPYIVYREVSNKVTELSRIESCKAEIVTEDSVTRIPLETLKAWAASRQLPEVVYRANEESNDYSTWYHLCIRPMADIQDLEKMLVKYDNKRFHTD